MDQVAKVREVGRRQLRGRSHNLGPALRKTLRKPQFWFGASVLVPTFIWYSIFGFGPILRAFWLATVRYQILNPADSAFVGLDNFRQLFDNPLFFIAVRNTFTWAVLEILFLLPLSIVVSVCLVNVSRGRQLYQTILFIPVVISLVAVVLLFRMLLDPDIGQINRILRSAGLPGPRWLTDSSIALPTTVGIGAWKGLGFYVIILTAGMLNIPRELNDAAVVDGTNEWQRFWRITLPLLGHTLALVMVLLVIGGLQQFTLPFILTGGGPGKSTYLFNLLIYNEAFQELRFGIATAAALLQFAFILLISVVQLKLIRPKWSY